MADDDFLKIVVDIPKGDLGIYGEGLWTKPLGNDLYEVQNSPWHSREINFLDIVKAIAPAEDKHPIFIEVRQRSGHRTIQVILLEAGKPHTDEILDEIEKHGGTYERANTCLFALDFAPEIDWDFTKTYLDACTEKQWLEYRWSAY